VTIADDKPCLCSWCVQSRYLEYQSFHTNFSTSRTSRLPIPHQSQATSLIFYCTTAVEAAHHFPLPSTPTRQLRCETRVSNRSPYRHVVGGCTKRHCLLLGEKGPRHPSVGCGQIRQGWLQSLLGEKGFRLHAVANPGNLDGGLPMRRDWRRCLLEGRDSRAGPWTERRWLDIQSAG